MASAVVLTHWESDRSVHETALRSPSGAAEISVRGYVGYEEWPTSPMTRREIARCGIALILAFGDRLDVRDGIEGPTRSLGAFVVGNQSRASLTELGGHQHGVQVELSDAGAAALFGPVRDLNDMVISVDEVLGSLGERIVEQLGNASTWEERFALLDHFFAARQPSEGNWSSHVIAPEVLWLRNQLVASSGQARVEPLMDETGWSRRVVTERFHSQLGVSPKAYARIVRFKRAVSLLDGVGRGRTLADVAMECGYYDQSHFTRECVTLAGCSPSVLMAESTGEPGVRFFQDGEPVGSVQ
jgi:AraC-like DNA-binding protein